MERVHSGPAVGLIGQLILLFVLSETVGLGAVGWLVGTACGVVTATSLSYGMTLSGRLALGAANRVTLLRATLVGGVTVTQPVEATAASTAETTIFEFMVTYSL